ncbi:MAG: hypothetical protein KDB74_13450 [Flavobacteriales bacterium]|nr:hypothetical protein [Flavobacteriales bacterium]
MSNLDGFSQSIKIDVAKNSAGLCEDTIIYNENYLIFSPIDDSRRITEHHSFLLYQSKKTNGVPYTVWLPDSIKSNLTLTNYNKIQCLNKDLAPVGNYSLGIFNSKDYNMVTSWFKKYYPYDTKPHIGHLNHKSNMCFIYDDNNSIFLVLIGVGLDDFDNILLVKSIILNSNFFQCLSIERKK